jgi:hypothetical protein
MHFGELRPDPFFGPVARGVVDHDYFYLEPDRCCAHRPQALVQECFDVVVDYEDRKAHAVKLAFNSLLVGNTLLDGSAERAFVGVF